MEPTRPDDLGPDSPRHGYRGHGPAPAPPRPKAVTVAVSREAGARGGTIGRRVGRLLGWQVYDQELLEYMAQEGVSRQNVLDPLPADASRWCEDRIRQLEEARPPGQSPLLINL